MSLWLSLLLAAVVVGCDYPEPPLELCGEPHNAHISSLATLAEMGPFEGVVIEGRVTANDLAGNFFRSIVVEDHTGAVEICLAAYELAALYPVGCSVVVDLDGLWCQPYDGVLQVGRVVYEWDDYRVEPIATRREIERRVRVSGAVEPLAPMVVGASELTEEMCGRLVKVGPLVLAEEAEYEGEILRWGNVDYGSNCNRLFVAEDGTRVVVRTSLYADFAQVAIPNRSLSLTGILYRDRLEGEDIFVLKMRSLEDVE